MGLGECKKHGETEYSKHGNCMACARDRAKKYNELNYEKVRARQNELRREKNALKNAGKVKYPSKAARMAAWKLANPEKIKQQTERGKERAAVPLEHSQLVAALDYNQSTGIFFWKENRGRGLQGTVAGMIDKDGYRNIVINRKRYYAHRLAWMYINGELPGHDLDHINRKRDDNSIANLRPSCDADNAQNQSVAKNNTSGHQGVHWCKQHNKWRAGIRVNRKQINLGRFESVEDAASAYREAAKVYHPLKTVLES